MKLARKCVAYELAWAIVLLFMHSEEFLETYDASFLYNF